MYLHSPKMSIHGFSWQNSFDFVCFFFLFKWNVESQYSTKFHFPTRYGQKYRDNAPLSGKCSLEKYPSEAHVHSCFVCTPSGRCISFRVLYPSGCISFRVPLQGIKSASPGEALLIPCLNDGKNCLSMPSHFVGLKLI